MWCVTLSPLQRSSVDLNQGHPVVVSIPCMVVYILRINKVVSCGYMFQMHALACISLGWGGVGEEGWEGEDGVRGRK